MLVELYWHSSWEPLGMLLGDFAFSSSCANTVSISKEAFLPHRLTAPRRGCRCMLLTEILPVTILLKLYIFSTAPTGTSHLLHEPI